MPNTFFINCEKVFGSTLIRSLVPLEQGQEVSENYGPVFYFKSKSEREVDLASRYWFNCECKACTEDWPKLKECNRQSGQQAQNKLGKGQYVEVSSFF